LAPSALLAQRQPAPTPEQRIDRLERQVDQMQRQVFPKGRPASTAGFSDDPAATAEDEAPQEDEAAIDRRKKPARVHPAAIAWAILVICRGR